MEKILGHALIRKKGELTIPKPVRKYLKIRPGDKICIISNQGKIFIKKEEIVFKDFDIEK